MVSNTMDGMLFLESVQMPVSYMINQLTPEKSALVMNDKVRLTIIVVIPSNQ